MSKPRKLAKLLSKAPQHGGTLKLPKKVLAAMQKHVLLDESPEVLNTDFPPWLKSRVSELKDKAELLTLIERSDMDDFVEMPREPLHELNMSVFSVLAGTSLSLASPESIEDFCNAVVEIILNQEIMPKHPSHVEDLIPSGKLPGGYVAGAESLFQLYFEDSKADVDIQRFTYLISQLALIIE